MRFRMHPPVLGLHFEIGLLDSKGARAGCEPQIGAIRGVHAREKGVNRKIAAHAQMAWNHENEEVEHCYPGLVLDAQLGARNP